MILKLGTGFFWCSILLESFSVRHLKLNLFEINRAVRQNNVSSHVFDNLVELQMHPDYTLAPYSSSSKWSLFGFGRAPLTFHH